MTSQLSDEQLNKLCAQNLRLKRALGVVTIILVLGVVWVASQSKYRINVNSREQTSGVLRPKMSMSEVESLFGQPDRIDVVDGKIEGKFETPKQIIWTYSRFKITESGEGYGKPGHIRFVPMRFMDQNWGQDDETARQYGEQSDTFRTCSFSGSFPVRKKDWAEDEGRLFDGIPVKEIKK